MVSSMVSSFISFLRHFSFGIFSIINVRLIAKLTWVNFKNLENRRIVSIAKGKKKNAKNI